MKHLLFSVLVVACVGLILPAQSPAQGLQDSPEAAGVTALSGNIILDRGLGGTHRFAAAWPAIMPNGQIVVAYPAASEARSDERAPLVAIIDTAGNVLEPSLPGFVDDEGGPVVERDFLGGDTRGIAVDASRSGTSMYATVCKASPWKYPGPLESWGSGTKGTLLANDGGVPVIQVFAADGTPLSPLVNVWTDEQIGDGGDMRGRMCVFLSNGNIAFNFWDRKASPDTGLRWIDQGYEGSGEVVGIVIIAPNGDVVLEPTPVSTPSPDGAGAYTMRGMAAGNGWFACRFKDSDGVLKYKVFDNAGNLLQTILGAAGLQGGGLDEATAISVAGDRGDSELLWGQGDYLYTIGGSGGHVYVAKWDAKAGVLVRVVQATQNAGFQGERMDVCADPSGNVFAMWGDASFGGTGDLEAIGRFFDPDLNPVTDSFAVFEGANVVDSDVLQWKDVSCRMNADIVVATCHADGDPDNPFALGGESVLEHVVRILENPNEASNVKRWELY